MDIKLLKSYKIHTFSFLERALLASVIMLGLSCRALVAEALAGALIREASASSDIWPSLFPFSRPFLWACCSLGMHNVEAQWSADLLPFETPWPSDIFLWDAGSWFLSLRTCCRRWVSSVWSCLWLIGPRTGAENLCTEDCCGEKLE